MSRSYKHTYYCGDTKTKSSKRQANKSVRRWLKDHPDELLCGKAFRKVYCTYDIVDYYWIYWSYRQFLDDERKNVIRWNQEHPNKEKEFDEDAYYQRWIRYYFTK